MTGKDNWIQRLGGTKFVLAFGSACACSILVWFHKIDGFIFRDVVLGCVGTYIAGNVIQAVKSNVVAKS